MIKILLALIIGLACGMTLGINSERDKSMFSNPFAEDTLADKVKRLGNSAMKQADEKFMDTKQALKKKLDN